MTKQTQEAKALELVRTIAAFQFTSDPDDSIDSINSLINRARDIVQKATDAKPTQKPVCGECGGDDILCDAYAEWDTDAQDWSLQNTFEQTVCNDCGGECSIEWIDC